MKKFTKVFVVFCLMLALTLSLVACATSGTLGKDEQGRFLLAVPEVTISNNVLSWKKVRYNVGYEARIDDGESVQELTFDSNRTSYALQATKAVRVQLRALGDNEKSVSSAFSEWVSNTTKSGLATPEQPTIKEDGDKIVISWNEIANATSYSIEQSQKINLGITTYSSATNSFVIEKSKFENPDVYYFRIMARNNEFFPSAYSKRNEYIKTQTLDEIEPRHNGSNITWATVPNVTNYRIYVEKYSGDGANEEKIVVSTVSSSSTTYTNTQVSNAVNQYKTEWEKKHPNQTIALPGGYRIYLQPINADNPEVYLEQEPVLVKKIVGSGESEKLEDIVYKKPGKVENLKVGKGDVTVDDGLKTVDLLTWECEDFEKFKLKFYSNGANFIDTNTTIEEGKDRNANLTSRFTGDYKAHAGKVMEVSITIQMDFDQGVLEGEETFLLVDGTENKEKYCFVPDELTQLTDEGEFKDYFKVNNLGDFRYMLDNSVAGGKYFLTEDIDGAKSSTNCDFYVGENIFEGTFDGCGHIISNVNLIINSNSTDKSYISLFKEIAAGAVFKNITFNNVTITCEDTNVKTVALIAGTNNGTIECVNIVSSKFETNCTTAGFVVNNKGNINSCGFLSTQIIANAYDESKALDVAAIAITNESKIFNASIYQSGGITATTKFDNVRAGGVAVENSGEITNSFVKNTLVKATTSANGSKDIMAIAGGIVAVNNGGSISECYVNNNGNTTKTVEAVTTRWTGTTAAMNSVAGGLIGMMDGGLIDSCYLSYARISANQKSSGLIGDKSDAAISISNCYVYRITLAATEERSMILAKTAGVTVKNVYCFVGDANPTNRNNVEVINFSSDLIKQDLGDKFVKYTTDYKEEPILKNMIYSNYSTSNLKVFIVTMDENPVALEPVSTDVGSKRLQIYSQEINGMKLFLPIFRSK